MTNDTRPNRSAPSTCRPCALIACSSMTLYECLVLIILIRALYCCTRQIVLVPGTKVTYFRDTLLLAVRVYARNVSGLSTADTASTINNNVSRFRIADASELALSRG